MNQQGFPCSKNCAGSQAGRGGLFLALTNKRLRDTAAALLHFVCACDRQSVQSKRFCGFGCERKIFLKPTAVPRQTNSAWTVSAGWRSRASCAASTTQRKGYDHQVQTYDASRYPPATNTAPVRLTTFFSPDTSATTMTALVANAKQSITIMTPSASAWSSYGCTSAAQLRSDAFPVFGALLNALHRGVAVQILTNNFGEACPGGTIKMLTFLQLNGARIQFYRSTTFLHVKLLAVDGWSKTAISSVNWSHSSYMQNREAGAVLSAVADTVLTSFLKNVFEGDWSAGTAMQAAGGYNTSTLAIITDKRAVPVHVPKRTLTSGCFVSIGFSAEVKAGAVTVAASPDHAFATLSAQLDAARRSIEVYMYQIYDPGLVKTLIRAHSRGVQLTIVVSASIFAGCDCFKARAAYAELVRAGIRIRKSSATCTHYQHQKFWIVDESDVAWSTGNWDAADYPTGSSIFPPIPSNAWRKTNRDFTVFVRGEAGLASHFRQVLTKDSHSPTAADWQPWSDIQCGPASSAAVTPTIPAPVVVSAGSGATCRKCTTTVEFQDCIKAVNAACCKKIGDCHNGLPTKCTTNCASALLPVEALCSRLLERDTGLQRGVKPILDQADAMCSGAH